MKLKQNRKQLEDSVLLYAYRLGYQIDYLDQLEEQNLKNLLGQLLLKNEEFEARKQMS